MLNKFIEGLECEGVEVTVQKLVPVLPYEFPFRSYGGLIKATIETFFQVRFEIEPIEEKCYGRWDRIVVAGPTWSYHPSGPVIEFFKQVRERSVRGATGHSFYIVSVLLADG